MALDLTPEQRTKGEANFKEVVEHLKLNRRDFLKSGVLATGAVAGSAAAIYFGYQSLAGNPVKAALIGGGDEGGVLVGEHNPEFLKFVAVCDIRPSNMTRIFEGDPKVPLRKGFKKVYGFGVEQKHHPDYIAKYPDPDSFYQMLGERKDIEAVVIALPLHLHAPVAIKIMQIGEKRGKPIHVLCEKLMAWNITQCKQMVKVAKQTGSILSIGHQRHYSMVYAHALEVIKSGTLGDVKHIRALWHRNFSWPWADSDKWQPPANWVKGVPQPAVRDGWYPPLLAEDYDALKDSIAELKMFDHPQYDSVEQLIRWRLHAETGGGLMAELGSHQLDAASIFLGKVHPLAVSGVGTHCFFGEAGKPNSGPNPRNIDDHVFVTYEFPGKDYYQRDDRGEIVRDSKGKALLKKKDDIVVVTYSSISTNGLEQYGECLMGTRGSMIVEAEQRVMLYPERNPNNPKQKGDARSLSVDVGTLKKDGAAAEASSTWGGPAANLSAGKAAGAAGGPPSRGYREEMEDFAYCVRLWNAELAREEYKTSGKTSQRLPRCHGEVAMADAIVALSANLAMRNHGRIEFKDEWFKAADKAVPDDDSKPKIPVEGVEVG
jgi:predicted dehydrogenase